MFLAVGLPDENGWLSMGFTRSTLKIDFSVGTIHLSGTDELVLGCAPVISFHPSPMDHLLQSPIIVDLFSSISIVSIGFLSLATSLAHRIEQKIAIAHPPWPAILRHLLLSNSISAELSITSLVRLPGRPPPMVTCPHLSPWPHLMPAWPPPGSSLIKAIEQKFRKGNRSMMFFFGKKKRKKSPRFLGFPGCRWWDWIWPRFSPAGEAIYRLWKEINIVGFVIGTSFITYPSPSHRSRGIHLLFCEEGLYSMASARICTATEEVGDLPAPQLIQPRSFRRQHQYPATDHRIDRRRRSSGDLSLHVASFAVGLARHSSSKKLDLSPCKRGVPKLPNIVDDDDVRVKIDHSVNAGLDYVSQRQQESEDENRGQYFDDHDDTTHQGLELIFANSGPSDIVGCPPRGQAPGSKKKLKQLLSLVMLAYANASSTEGNLAFDTFRIGSSVTLGRSSATWTWASVSPLEKTPRPRCRHLNIPSYLQRHLVGMPHCDTSASPSLSSSLVVAQKPAPPRILSCLLFRLQRRWCFRRVRDVVFYVARTVSIILPKCQQEYITIPHELAR
ncbi:hypothetical protein NE237_001271 [Protea cynaroides]|uniref:Uncharacterized protein n=1 Tax=Protea cynaroides TaxID=273540 RepID=A0A9Q0QXX4_9MAGN|nr:hypothetical protein NE237_001271 [Protea cynaroides]